jgi:hypothetical protein
MAFNDFVQHIDAKTAQLSEAHVLVLRLYTTAAFKVINGPLRAFGRSSEAPPHRLPVTVTILQEVPRAFIEPTSPA